MKQTLIGSVFPISFPGRFASDSLEVPIDGTIQSLVEPDDLKTVEVIMLEKGNNLIANFLMNRKQNYLIPRTF